MDATSKNKKKEINVPERDFIKEYNEMFGIIGRDLDSMEHEWKREGDHIKKFSLYKKSPTPILSNNTSNC